ncbi:hypothetical protein HU200_005037 [Digitaria exilis]|uniref:Uncharacterized protein n=1 Tax=Digitaria exilis TaxID=1010633 RepID=A0A835FSJ5_9POAL|nr:hypothetical protein HU200_005037 [Digitaria exilis]
MRHHLYPLLVVVAGPDTMDPRAAAAAEASVKMEESLRSMAELKEKMISRGLIPSRRPPPKRWWFQRLSKVAIARRRNSSGSPACQGMSGLLQTVSIRFVPNSLTPLRICVARTDY